MSQPTALSNRLQQLLLWLACACSLAGISVAPSAGQADQPSVGEVTLAGVLTQNGRAVPGNRFRIRAMHQGEHGQQVADPLENRTYDQITLHLPAGRYHVDVRNGEARASGSIEVAAGRTRTYRFNLRAGLVKLSMRKDPGKPRLRDTDFAVYVTDRFGPRYPPVIERDSAAAISVTLPEGRYLAQASNRSRRGQARFQVRAGDALMVEIPPIPASVTGY